MAWARKPRAYGTSRGQAHDFAASADEHQTKQECQSLPSQTQKKCGSSRHEPTGAVLVELSSYLTQPFTATLTGFESLKVNWDLAERVELSFFCLSVLLSLDLLAAALVLAAWILSDGRRELVCRS